jgi:hypothetical protein
MKQLTQQIYNQLFYQAPKRSIGIVNNVQALEAPTSKGVLFGINPNELIKSKLTPLFNIPNEYDKERVIMPEAENNKRPIIISPSININPATNYLTSPNSPSFCEDNKPKAKKRRSIGINTIKTFKNESEGNLNKFTANLSNVPIFFFILNSFIGVIII